MVCEYASHSGVQDAQVQQTVPRTNAVSPNLSDMVVLAVVWRLVSVAGSGGGR